MGRYAQQRKRGGHSGADGGLPAGPAADWWELEPDVPHLFARWTYEGDAPYDHWRARWRVPAVSMLWTLGGFPVAATDEDETQLSPLPLVAGQQQDCEIIYCDVDGNAKSQWSAYQSATV